MKVLRGITWNHDRGLLPMLATASEFGCRHPDVQILWEVQSLQHFADFPLHELAARYDLMVLDHPHIGAAARSGSLISFDRHDSSSRLPMLRSDSVGRSFDSYVFDGELWALPIDAAAQVAAYRPDMLDELGCGLPRTWDDVMALGRMRPGAVGLPLLPTDAFLAFLTLCANSGETPFTPEDGTVVGGETGLAALAQLEELASLSIPECLMWNPIQMWEHMTGTNTVVYCPLGFGYSNYSRSGYRKQRLKFTDIPKGRHGKPSGGVLGGTGIGISPHCQSIDAAIDYAFWVAGRECQSTTYYFSGGQPASLRAWRDKAINDDCGEFFLGTQETLHHSYLRPNWNGFIEFQNAAFACTGAFLRKQASARDTLRVLNELALQSKTI